MRTLSYLGLLLLCSTAMAGPNIIDGDDRMDVSSEDRHLSRAVGILYSPDHHSCTATLVGPDLILTAAHCVMDSNLGQLKIGTFTFMPDVRKGVAYAEARAVHIWWGSSHPQNDRVNDWSIIKLDRRLGDKYGWMGVSDVDLDERFGKYDFNMIGYGEGWRDKQTPSIQNGCAFLGKDRYGYLHNCDMAPGYSGAGIYVTDESGEAFIVAVNASERRNGADHSLVGVRFSPETANVAVPASQFIQTLEPLFRESTQPAKGLR